jgi:hypothetical protein
LFEEARKKVIQHYQWIVLNDYLRKITGRDWRENPPIKPARKELSLPVEFAFAAFRFGHSMVNNRYEWNRVFESPKTDFKNAAPLHELFTFTGLSGNMREAPTLPTNWVIDWSRFYDFGSHKNIQTNTKFNMARKIGPSLSLGLKTVPGFPADIPVESRSLAALDLQTGAMLGLPLGQEVAESFKLKALSDSEIADGLNNDAIKILTDNNLHKETPLWYYILREAELQNDGECLGEVGGRIVADTVIGLVKASNYSILKNGKWEPDLGQIQPNQFDMTELLVFSKKYGNSFLNLPEPAELNQDSSDGMRAKSSAAGLQS